MRRTILLLIAPLFIGASFAAASLQDALDGIRPVQIRAHLMFLADDLLEGRAPGTRGEAIAARYIAAQLARSGVEPVRGRYRHDVPLIGWRPDPARIGAAFATSDRTVELSYPADAVLWLDNGMDSTRIAADLVFVGYGAVAPEFGWNDYDGADVNGRIVLVLSGDPPAIPGQPASFDGGALSYYGRYTYKIEEAARQGAAGVLIVHTDEGAGYSWDVVRSSWTNEQLALPDSGAASPVAVQGWVTFDAARRILAAAGTDLSELYVRAARRDFRAVSARVTATLRAVGRTRRFAGANVAGIVRGSHDSLRNDVVIYTAHHDHLGIGPARSGDSVYNGAYDNASGVALLLEVAEAFAALPTAPARSVLFLFTTAEEAGMLGATWYTRQPLMPLSRTVAALNIDGANVWGETDDIAAVGLERSTLGIVFERQAERLGLRVEGERAPAQGFYFRSDHFPFARAGIPALYLDHGTHFRNRSMAWGDSVLGRYQARRYHTPDDEFDPGFDLTGAGQQARQAFLVGHAVASTPDAPRWYPGGANFGR